MDPKVNGQLQHHWGWLIAVYLFLGGVGGGAYTVAAINGFIGESMQLPTVVGLWIGFPALLIGTLFLLADLGSPTRAVLAGRKPGTSWIARGTWIISVFMVLSFLHLVVYQFTDIGQSAGGSALLSVIAVAGSIFAIATMAYTGILLGASRGIPFWRSGVVPVVFVISAVVTGHFAIMLGVALFAQDVVALAPLQGMALEAAALVILEALAIVFFLQAAYQQPDSRESAERILRKRMFVFGYFVLGLAVPLALMLVAYSTVNQPGEGIVTIGIGALLGLVGGLILRQAVLVCGTLPTLNVAGFKFRRIARPREPKPSVGLLPPR